MKNFFGRLMVFIAGLGIILVVARGYILGIIGVEATAAITDVKKTEKFDSDTNNYDVEVKQYYRFNVDGKTYTGIYSHSYSNYSKGQNAYNKACSQTSMKIKYLASNPDISSPTQYTKTDTGTTIIRIAVGLLGLFLIITAIRPGKKGKPAAKAAPAPGAASAAPAPAPAAQPAPAPSAAPSYEPSQVAPATQRKINFCPSCGGSVQGSKFCKFCGQKL